MMIRTAFKSLRRSPGLAIAAVACLALGTAATSAVTTLVGALLLRPLPFPDADRLVRVWFEEPGISRRVSLSIPELHELSRVTAFDRFVGTARVRVVALLGQGAERFRGEAVSPHYFDTLGIRAAIGRLLLPEDHAASSAPALVLSHGAWSRFFGSDPGVIGRELRTARAVYTIVGVSEAGFEGSVEDDVVEFFVPLEHYEPRSIAIDRMSRPAWAIARLAPGATIADARGQVEGLRAALAGQHPDVYRRLVTSVEPLGESWREALRGGGGVLFAASAALLMVAAINVGCLLLARVLDRRRELAIRASLGAGGRQIVTQLFVEALVLVLAGGMAGAVAGPWVLDVFLSLSPVTLPAYVALTPDATTVGLAGAALAIAGIIAGTVPASVGRRVHPGDVLRDSGRGTLGRVAERRWTAILIAGEAALTLVLLVAGGLLVRSFDRLDSMEMGFDRARIARLAVTLNATEVGGSEGLPALFARIRERIATVPGVNRVGLVATTLPPWDADRRRLLLQGVDLDPRAEGLEAGIHYADEGLLPMLGTPVVSGRNIAAQDVVGSADIALVSRALADLVGGPEGAIGRTVTLLPETPAGARRDFRIIGVAENVAWDGLREQDTRRYIRYGDASDARAARYDVYLALAQSPATVVSVGVWTPGDPSQMIEPVRRAIAAIVPRSAVHWTSTMDDEVALEYEASRFYSLIVAAFSLSALLLTSIGLFALLSHAAAQRMGEMGLRMALGASRQSAGRLLLRTALLPLTAGVVAGLGGAAAVTRSLSGLLYGVGRFDSATFTLAAAALVAVALIAGVIPARRVAAANPADALRAG